MRAGRADLAVDYIKKAADGALAKFGEKHVKTAHLPQEPRHRVRLAAALGRCGRADRTRGAHRERALSAGESRCRQRPQQPRQHAAHARPSERRAEDARRRARAQSRRGPRRLARSDFVLGNLARVHEMLGDLDGAAARSTKRAAPRTRSSGPITRDTHARSAGRARRGSSAIRKPRLRLQKVAASNLEHPENLAQFRPRSEPERAGRSASRSRRSATKRQPAPPGKPGSMRCRPIASIRRRCRSSRRSRNPNARTAISMRRLRCLNDYIDRSTREFAATHYGVGLLHLELAETKSADRAAAIVELDAADAAFAELPPDHAWRVRSATLRRSLR